MARRPRMIETLPRWITVLVAGLLVAVAVIWIAQRRLIYFPIQAVPDPETIQPGIEEVTYATEDGLTLSAWWVPAAGSMNAGTVVVFNGNAGNRSHRAPLAAALSHAGYAVLLVDYRGYGGNPGSPSEDGLALDARAALHYVSSRPDFDPDRLVYFGESLGGAVALGLAQHREPAALVLRSPFTSLPDIASVHYPYLPTSLLLWDRYPSQQMIRGMGSPLLVIAGSSDTIVPVEQSTELYQAAPGSKHLVIIDGADHNDYPLFAGAEMIGELVAFLGEVLPADG